MLVAKGSSELKLEIALLYHEKLTLLAVGSDELKLSSDVQPYHAAITLDAVGNGVLNEVSPLCRHALSKVTPLLASVPSFAPSENDVSDEQPNHADVKLFPVLKSNAGKLVSPLSRHALVKFTLLASVPSFASCGNDVSEEQSCHADVKYFPLLKSNAENAVSGVSRNAFWKLTLADATAVPSNTPESIVVS